MGCLELVSLRGKNVFKSRPKAGSWYLLGIPDEHTRPFYLGVYPLVSDPGSNSLFSAIILPCFAAKRSRAVEEAAQYNYIFDEIKGNSSCQTETATHYVVRTLPPRPSYQSVDPSTKEPVRYERRHSEIHIYEELDFRRLSDGQNYENLRKIKVDVEYLELVDDPKLTTGNAASEVCNYPDGGKVDVDGYLEPVNAAKDLPDVKATYDCKVDHEYFELELVSDTDLHCGKTTSTAF